MIAAKLHNDGKTILLLVLEPGNIEKLKKGEPIHKFLGEFFPELNTKIELMFAYTPDAAWVAEQLQRSGNSDKLATILHESLSRPEVVIRGKSAEDMRKEF